MKPAKYISCTGKIFIAIHASIGDLGKVLCRRCVDASLPQCVFPCAERWNLGVDLLCSLHACAFSEPSAGETSIDDTSGRRNVRPPKRSSTKHPIDQTSAHASALPSPPPRLPLLLTCIRASGSGREGGRARARRVRRRSPPPSARGRSHSRGAR